MAGSLWLILVAEAWLSNQICDCMLFVFELHQCYAFMIMRRVWLNLVRPGRPSLLDGRTDSKRFEAFGLTDYVVGTWILVDDFRLSEEKEKKKKRVCKHVNLSYKFISDATSQIQAPSPILSEAHPAAVCMHSAHDGSVMKRKKKPLMTARRFTMAGHGFSVSLHGILTKIF